ncbi:MAG: glycine C-acetyltransferase [Endozoicomonadaceae bacterium]|nr:glycine C-acetyltransferase [Endozoicomonadaceae bacterium]
MSFTFYQSLKNQLDLLNNQHLNKAERIIISQQAAKIKLQSGQIVLNFCANNYLGLANHPKLIQSAQAALDEYGYGLASVRFICGTQSIHKRLEAKLSHFLEMDDTILYSSCFDANTGLFETILDQHDAIISDTLNHASIIDGVRLCKAKKYRYQNNDMSDLAVKLEQATKEGARYKLIVTDGVFSMDGIIADLNKICDLADQYEALVMVDDSHAVGFIGPSGKGTHEYEKVMGRVDIITGTLGKALGGASGGYTSGRKDLIEWLRNRSRPYLFSNTLCPAIAAASVTALDLIQNEGVKARQVLQENSQYFRRKMNQLGFYLAGLDHPIIPVMLGDAGVTKQFAKDMLLAGVYVTDFSYPVVPKNQARIRTQMSALHTREQLDQAISAFKTVGKKNKIIE